jgi:hypothetical protein
VDQKIINSDLDLQMIPYSIGGTTTVYTDQVDSDKWGANKTIG